MKEGGRSMYLHMLKYGEFRDINVDVPHARCLACIHERMFRSLYISNLSRSRACSTEYVFKCQCFLRSETPCFKFLEHRGPWSVVAA